jgi:hypothetical protein
MREVNGDFWVLTNCDLNKTSQLWTQTNPALPSYGARFVGGASGGAIIRYQQIAGAVPWGLTALGGAPAGWSQSAQITEQAFQNPGNLLTTGSLVAGSATAVAPVSGDVAASRSATTGAVSIGGSGSNALIDYGVTTASVVTSSTQLNVPTLGSKGNGSTLSWCPPAFYNNAALSLNAKLLVYPYSFTIGVGSTTGSQVITLGATYSNTVALGIIPVSSSSLIVTTAAATVPIVLYHNSTTTSVTAAGITGNGTNATVAATCVGYITVLVW